MTPSGLRSLFRHRRLAPLLASANAHRFRHTLATDVLIKGGTEQETLERLRRDKAAYCVFGKTGGPYLRTTFVRGEEQFLLDIPSRACRTRKSQG